MCINRIFRLNLCCYSTNGGTAYSELKIVRVVQVYILDVETCGFEKIHKSLVYVRPSRNIAIQYYCSVITHKCLSR